MEESSPIGSTAAPSRRRFLAGSAGAIALAATAAACSSSDKAATTPAADTAVSGGSATSGSADPFEVMSAGGRLGWHGMAALGVGQSNKVYIIDAQSHNAVTALTNVGPYHERTDPSKYPNLRDCHAIATTKDFKRMFTVTAFNYEVSTVIEYDPLTLREVTRVNAGRGSHHMALTPDDKHLYVANQYGPNISVIDTATMKHIKDIPVGSSPDYISPTMYWDSKAIDTPYMFATIDGAKTLAVLDWKTHTVFKQIPMPANAHGVNLTPDGKHVWLAGLAFKEVWVIENPSLKIVKKLAIPGSPIHISISPDNEYAYVTTSDNSIYKVATKNYQTLWSAKGTVIPAHTGLSPDGKELWTLNHGMDTTRYPFLLGGQPCEGVQIWDTDNGTLIGEIPMEAMPHEIQFMPYSAFGVPAPKQDYTPGVAPTTAATTKPSGTGT